MPEKWIILAKQNDSFDGFILIIWNEIAGNISTIYFSWNSVLTMIM